MAAASFFVISNELRSLPKGRSVAWLAPSDRHAGNHQPQQ
jgi:hypothetical protein